MTQPSVSQAVRELEEHYGILLFERLGRKLFLTAAGEELTQYARHLVQLAVQTEAAMQSFRQECHIRVGASVTVGEAILVELLVRAKSELPEVEVLAEVHNTSELEHMLLKDELDIALVEGKITSPYLKEQVFMQDELVFLAAPEVAGQQGWEAADLSRTGFFVREEGSGTRRLFEQEMAAHAIPFHIAGVFNNTETIKKAVRAGLGLTVISRRSAKEELAAGVLQEFMVPGIRFRRNFRFVYHKNKFLPQGLKQFMALGSGLAD
jgi:DNA-binding transcriptional LysR family regulator